MKKLVTPPQLHKKFRISLCTTCMGRLHHLKHTLVKNLEDNLAYENIEFVVLNYNSRDGLDQWMRDTMIDHIRNQTIVYIKTTEPQYFKVAHAKNLVTRFASGDIICNVDADNFTGSGFADYVNEQFNKDSNIFLRGERKYIEGVAGRACFLKSDFLRLRGYDEQIQDYGLEDIDLYSRLKNIGRREKKLTDKKYLNVIQHSARERMKNGRYMDEIEFGLRLVSEKQIEAYVLRQDYHLEFINISDMKGLANDGVYFQTGEWAVNGNQLVLRKSSDGRPLCLSTKDKGKTYLSSDGCVYERIPKVEACLRYSLLMGEIVLQKNVMLNQASVNPKGYGKGSLTRILG